MEKSSRKIVYFKEALCLISPGIPLGRKPVSGQRASRRL